MSGSRNSRAPKVKLDKTIILYIGDRALTLEELGPAADMRLPEALQYIIDSGLVGNYPEGTQWYEVFKPGCFKTVGPTEDNELEQVLFDQLRELELEIQDRLDKGGELVELLEEERSALVSKLNRLRMAKKLNSE